MCWTPALLTRTSSWPYSAAARSTIVPSWATCVTSTAASDTRRPVLRRTSAAVSAMRAGLTSASARSLPSSARRRAVARPMPPPAPVINDTLPSRRISAPSVGVGTRPARQWEPAAAPRSLGLLQVPAFLQDARPLGRAVVHRRLGALLQVGGQVDLPRPDLTKLLGVRDPREEPGERHRLGHQRKVLSDLEHLGIRVDGLVDRVAAVDGPDGGAFLGG